MILPLCPPFVRPTPVVLHPALRHQIQVRHGFAGAGPGEGHEDDQSAGGAQIRRQPERMHVDKPGEGSKETFAAFPCAKGAYKKVFLSVVIA